MSDNTVSSKFSALAAASNNATVVLAGKARLVGGIICNTSATKYYLKLYDKATAPVPGTDTPVYRVQLLAGTNQPLQSVIDATGIYFNLGLAFVIVAGVADADNTSVTAANDVITNLNYLNG